MINGTNLESTDTCISSLHQVLLYNKNIMKEKIVSE